MNTLIALLLCLLTFNLTPTASAQERVGELLGKDMERVQRRMETLNLWEVSFGGGNAENLNTSHGLYAFNVARHWEVNVNGEIRATGHLTSSAEGAYTSLGIGGAWIALPTDISPILGGEFGIGYAGIKGRPDQSGFSFGAFGGARFFRTAKAQMSLEGYYRTILTAGPNAAVYGVTLGALF